MKLASNNSTSFLSGATEDDEIDFTDYSAPFLSGHGFALRCHRFYSPKMRELGVNPARDNDCVFVCADHLKTFFASGLVPDSFTLVTHNADTPIAGGGYAHILNDSRVRVWLAMNKAIKHPKLGALADGLQNACYVFGSARVFGAFQSALGHGHQMPPEYHYKRDLFHASFTIDSHFHERARAIAVAQPQGVTLRARGSFLDYVGDIARSMFTLCPAGSGVDSCRPYEAVYLKSIPIVRASLHSHEHATLHGMPMIALDDWTELEWRQAGFSHERWRRMMEAYDPREMEMEPYCERINRKYGCRL